MSVLFQVAQIIALLLPTITALLAYLQGKRVASAVDTVHTIMNSRLDALLKQTASVQRAEGKAEGIAEEKKRER